MHICRGNFAFELFLSLTHLIEIYTYSVMVIMSYANERHKEFFGLFEQEVRVDKYHNYSDEDLDGLFTSKLEKAKLSNLS